MILWKPTRVLMIALAGIILAAPAQAAEADKYLPNDTEVLVVVNVRQTLDSELGKKFGLEPLKGALKQDENTQKLLAALGFDPLKDIDSLAVAGPGGDDPKSNLIIVHGKFDTNKFHTMAAGVAEKEKDKLKIVKEEGYKFYEVKTDNDKLETIFIAIVDKTTIVASPGKKLIVDALDKEAGKKKSELGKEFKAILDKAEAKQSLTMIAMSKALAKSQTANQDMVKDVLDKVVAIQAGITVGKDVSFDAVVSAKDDKTAKDLSQQMSDGLDQAKGLVALLAGQDKKLAPLADVLDSLKISAKGNGVNIKGAIPADLIEKAMKWGDN